MAALGGRAVVGGELRVQVGPDGAGQVAGLVGGPPIRAIEVPADVHDHGAGRRGLDDGGDHE